MFVTARHGARAGAFVTAVWLIGLGVVFLLQQAWDLPWAQAWPLFVILAGIGSLASLAINARSLGRAFVGLAWPLLLVVAGVLFLLATTDNLGIGVGELIATWWPLALIAVGAWFLLGSIWPWGSHATSGPVHLGLDGAQSASVRIKFGGGELNVGAAPAGAMLTGSWEGIPGTVKRSSPATLELEPEQPGGWPWWEGTPRWEVGLTTEVPLELRLDSGAAKTRLDLSEHRLRSLRINTGASDTRVLLPRAAGETSVRADGGAASLVLEVPAGVAARIKSTMALGSTRVDESRFPRTGGGWESADYAAAQNRVEIEIRGGVGSAQVIGR